MFKKNKTPAIVSLTVAALAAGCGGDKIFFPTDEQPSSDVLLNNATGIPASLSRVIAPCDAPVVENEGLSACYSDAADLLVVDGDSFQACDNNGRSADVVVNGTDGILTTSRDGSDSIATFDTTKLEVSEFVGQALEFCNGQP